MSKITEKLKSGFFGIGIDHPKTKENIGTLFRSAFLYGADFIFTIGRRYKGECSDTPDSKRHLPLYHYEDFEDFYKHMPHGAQLVGIELIEGSVPLQKFVHPKQAIYLLGAEDSGLTKEAQEKCHQFIQIECPTPLSMNVSVAGTLVMYDRYSKTLITPLLN